MECGARAVRVHEGFETDQYLCEARHAFGIDWRGAPAEEPMWPPPPGTFAPDGGPGA